MMGKLLCHPLFVHTYQYSQSLVPNVLRLAACSKKASCLIHCHILTCRKIRDKSSWDLIRQYQFLMYSWRLNLIRFIMKERVIKEHCRMVIYPVF